MCLMHLVVNVVYMFYCGRMQLSLIMQCWWSKYLVNSNLKSPLNTAWTMSSDSQLLEPCCSVLWSDLYVSVFRNYSFLESRFYIWFSLFNKRSHAKIYFYTPSSTNRIFFYLISQVFMLLVFYLIFLTKSYSHLKHRPYHDS